MYKCERCGYLTTKISNFKTHLDRETICPPKLKNLSIEELREKLVAKTTKSKKCSHCEKTFNTYQGINYHMKVAHPIEETIEQEPIKINDYDSPNIDYITDEFTDSCFALDNKLSIYRLISHIYFNSEHHENHSIIIRNIKENRILVYKNGEWIPKMLDIIIYEIYERARCILFKRIPSSLNITGHEEADAKKMERIINVFGIYSEKEYIQIKTNIINKLREQKQAAGFTL